MQNFNKITPSQSRGFFLIAIFLMTGFVNTEAQRSDRQLRVNGREFRHNERPPLAQNNIDACPDTPFRSVDGTCNNTRAGRAEWGATDITLYRYMPTAYGAPDHLNDMSGQDRVSPRAISNQLSSQTESTPSSRGLSSFVFTWGQFLDHDISLTPEGETEYVPIEIPTDDPLFQNPIPFLRSEVHEGSGEGNTPRQQSNLITSWIDGSNVYGSDQERADWLRTFSNGKLKMSQGNFLPYNTLTGEAGSPLDPSAPSMAGDQGGTAQTIVAGDVRAAEQPGLTSLHTLFVREHNRICDALIVDGLSSDEEIYQTARKHVGALIQNITFQEFLPALGIDLGRYRGYDPSERPDISNLFATAAYRLGHTMVTDELLIMDNQCNPVGSGVISLLEGFFNPGVTASVGVDAILKGLSSQVQNEVDTKIIDNLRNFLFGDPSDPSAVGLDLASLNIQRGRDHGLPDYNTIRMEYTGRRANEFSDISDDPQVVQALQQAYNNDINNIDAWVGLLAEDLRRGASVGRTLRNIMERQFRSLRDGDVFYFENDDAIDRRLEDRIRRTQLSEIIERNTSLSDLPRNVFFATSCGEDLAENRSVIRNIEDITDFNYTPNPASDMIQIETSISQADQKIQLIDASGKVVQQRSISASATSKSTIVLDISAFQEGLYLIRLVSDTNVTTKKLIVVRD